MTISRPFILRLIVYGSLALLIGMMLLFLLPPLRHPPSNVGNVMRQLTLSCMVYANDNDGRWPATLEEARDYEYPNAHETAAQKALISSFCFIRPSLEASSGQPVVIDNPVGHSGLGVHVAYADGHIGLVRDPMIWEVACRLAASAKASGPGIDISDWPNDLPGVPVPPPAVLPAKAPTMP